MHGMIFIAIRQHLREQREDLLLRECFPSPTQYIVMGEYPPEDLLAIARKIARRRSFASQRPVEEVLRTLGEAVPGVAARLAPNLMPRANGFADLLAQLTAGSPMQGRTLLPLLTVRKRPDGFTELTDVGPPELCRFDEGLLVAHALLLGDAIALRHSSCRARGDADCSFVLRFVRPDSNPATRSGKRRES